MNCIACLAPMQVVEPYLEIINLSTGEVELRVFVWICPACECQDEIQVIVGGV